MAKVKNQNLPNNEILYHNNPDDPQYFGPEYRRIACDSFPNFPDAEWEVVRKSRSGRFPTTAGSGTPRQEKIRRAFKFCVSCWNALPPDCLSAAPCYNKPTKESIYRAKDDYGLICSYYDLFMRCCIDKILPTDEPFDCTLTDVCFPDNCTTCCYTSAPSDFLELKHNDEQLLAVIDPPDAAEWYWNLQTDTPSYLTDSNTSSPTFHALLDDGEMEGLAFINVYDRGRHCFYIAIDISRGCPLPSHIVCSTWHMNKNTSQHLYAVPCSQEDPPIEPEFTWAILGGGGSLNTTSGCDVVYTAPSSNPNCTNNPTIALYCDGALIDTQIITINAYTFPVQAARIWCPTDCTYYDESHVTQWVAYQNYKCDGGNHSNGSSRKIASSCSVALDYYLGLYLGPYCEMLDLRTEAQIVAGCCPPDYDILHKCDLHCE